MSIEKRGRRFGDGVRREVEVDVEEIVDEENLDSESDALGEGGRGSPSVDGRPCGVGESMTEDRKSVV